MKSGLISFELLSSQSHEQSKKSSHPNTISPSKYLLSMNFRAMFISHVDTTNVLESYSLIVT